MRVCLINNLYKPYTRGGAERVVEIIADGLRKAGHEIFIITTRPLFTKHETWNMKQAAKEEGQMIYYIRGFYYNLDRLPKFLRFFWHILDMVDVGSYLKVKRILKRKKPDVVMTHNLVGIGLLIPLAIKHLRAKHIHTLHDIQLLHPSGLMIYGQEGIVSSCMAKVYQFLCRALFSSVHTVISPSQWLMDEHTKREFFRGVKKVIRSNPVEAIYADQIQPRGQRKEFQFLYVGLIEESKGVLLLINAFNEFNAEKIFLIMAGDGTKIKRAKILAQENDNIKIIGWQAREGVQKLMREADCLIVPSLCYENSPTVIYEAAGAGLPVIASRIGGMTELAHWLGGILFQPGDMDDLVSQMKWAIRNPFELRKIGEKGRKKICQNENTMEKYTKQIMDS